MWYHQSVMLIKNVTTYGFGPAIFLAKLMFIVAVVGVVAMSLGMTVYAITIIVTDTYRHYRVTEFRDKQVLCVDV